MSIHIEGNYLLITIVGESAEIPDDTIDKLIRRSGRFLCKFSEFEVREQYQTSGWTKLYDYMADHPRLDELIRIELRYALTYHTPATRQKVLKCAQNVLLEELGSSWDEFEEFLDHIRNRKSARNV